MIAPLMAGSMTLCRECGIEMKCPTCEFGAAHFEGIEYSAYNEQVSSPELWPYLVQAMQTRLDRDLMEAADEPTPASVAQLIGSLFEIAAATAGLELPGLTDEERFKLHLLRRHAVEGVNLLDPGAEQ